MSMCLYFYNLFKNEIFSLLPDFYSFNTDKNKWTIKTFIFPIRVTNLIHFAHKYCKSKWGIVTNIKSQYLVTIILWKYLCTSLGRRVCPKMYIHWDELFQHWRRRSGQQKSIRSALKFKIIILKVLAINVVLKKKKSRCCISYVTLKCY